MGGYFRQRDVVAMNLRLSRMMLLVMVAIILFSFSAFAVVPNPAQAFRDLGAFLADLFRGGATYEGAYFLTLLSYFVIFLAIFIEGLKYIPFFGGKGEVSTPGKWFAAAAAALATIGIFLGEQTAGRSVQEIVQALTAPFALWAGLVLAVLFSLITYKGIRDMGLFRDSVMEAMAFSLAVGVMVAGWLVAPALIGWGFILLFFVAVTGIITHFLGRRREMAVKEVPLKEKTVEKEKQALTSHRTRRTLIRALRRVYRFNNKAYKDLKRAHQESLKGAKADTGKIMSWLQEAQRFEEKEIDFDSLVGDAVETIEKLAGSRPDLQQKLDVLNKSIQVNLSKIKEQIQKAGTTRNIGALSAVLVSALRASEELRTEILGLEAALKGLRKELEE